MNGQETRKPLDTIMESLNPHGGNAASGNATDGLLVLVNTLWNTGTLMCGAKRRKCGAKKRNSGEPCQAPPMPNGRCRIHGGKSVAAGVGHHRFKHGKYSKSPLEAIAHRAAVQERKRLRKKKREILKLTTAELKARARRLFGQHSSMDPEEVRRLMLDLYDAQIAATKVNPFASSDGNTVAAQ